MSSTRWFGRSDSPEWVMDAGGKLLGYKDEKGVIHSLPNDVVTSLTDANEIPSPLTHSNGTIPPGSASELAVRRAGVISPRRRAEIDRLSRRPLIRAPARANSTAVIVNDIVRFASGQLVQYTTAGTTNASEPTFSPTGAIADGTAVCYALGRVSLPAPDGVEIPTFAEGALGAIPAGLTTYDPASNTTNLLQRQTPNIVASSPVSYGWLFRDGSSVDYGVGMGATGASAGAYRTVEFYTDSTRVALVSISASVERYKVFVDDYPIEEAATAITTTGASRYLLATWLGRQLKKIRIECFGSQPLRDVRIDTNAVIYQPTDLGLSIIWGSDSFADTETPSQGHGIAGWSLASHVAKAVGARYLFDIHAGGTGYTNDNSATTPTKYTAKQMIANNDLSWANADAAVMCYGFNDRPLVAAGTVTQAQVVADALAAWRAMRTQNPSTTICVFGPWSNRWNADATAIALDAALQAAFIAWADPNSEWESTFTGSTVSGGVLTTRAISWFTGTGYVGGTTGTGNSDIYSAVDYHPSPAGKWYLKDRLAASLNRMLASRGL